MSTDLEFFKQIFGDKKTHVAIAKIKQLSLAADRSFLKCLVSIFPDQREVVARMTFSMTGPESGIIEFPAVDDLVLVTFADGENDYCFITSRLTSLDDKIPLNAADGHLVFKSKPTKKIWVTSDTRINLSKGDTEPTENVVLGQELKTLLISTYAKLVEMNGKIDELATKDSQHTHIGNLGYPTSAPNEAGDFIALAADFNTIAADFDAFSASPVEDELILSDISFTEKGN